ncbi:hypothetical protein D1818_08625 [Aquimarina sp. BL5]|uniref:hypothetical protein n=1 Tax=Aquimarina sp. BL5 TaxID=1714860 RepID=UPI000E505FCE|nr:hypothetical protein [Aquimarina sp. BL5]AXT50885.1 hypothetical protein D1818_08625 [Aquimarina sp. BL5]RKN02532.1 hypothetical protein D7036_16315 [Aquimarina sp. BL5]
MKKLTLLLLLITIGFNSCFDSSTLKSNKLDSDDYESKTERVEILRNEIKSFSDFKNAEFELFNVNGFSNSRTTLPGASSWDYKFVIKIDSSDIKKWTEGMIKTIPEDHDDKWMKEIIEKRRMEWQTTSDPEKYTRNGDNVVMIVYRSEAIIFKRVVNL